MAFISLVPHFMDIEGFDKMKENVVDGFERRVFFKYQTAQKALNIFHLYSHSQKSRGVSRQISSYG